MGANCRGNTHMIVACAFRCEWEGTATEMQMQCFTARWQQQSHMCVRWKCCLWREKKPTVTLSFHYVGRKTLQSGRFRWAHTGLSSAHTRLRPQRWLFHVFGELTVNTLILAPAWKDNYSIYFPLWWWFQGEPFRISTHILSFSLSCLDNCSHFRSYFFFLSCSVLIR